jgi:hypothetical protein
MTTLEKAQDTNDFLKNFLPDNMKDLKTFLMTSDGKASAGAMTEATSSEKLDTPEEQKKQALQNRLNTMFAPLQKMIDTGTMGDFMNFGNMNHYEVLLSELKPIDENAMVIFDEEKNIKISCKQWMEMFENWVNNGRQNAYEGTWTAKEFINLMSKLKLAFLQIKKVEVNEDGGIKKIYLEQPPISK